VKGVGSPAKTPPPSCVTSDVLPCSSSGARPTTPPYATAIDCTPRQTPKTGTAVSAQCRTMSTHTPASSGVPGPGESSTPSKPSPACAGETSSLRSTSHSAPSW